MKLTFISFSLALLAFTNQALALDGYCNFWACTRVAFQCPPGPGYMKMVAVNNQNNPIHKNWYLGSKAYCDVQKAVLDQTRTEIREPKLIAVCNETLPVNGKKSAYLTIYQIDQFANIYKQSQTFYSESPDECLKDAAVVNK